MELYIIPPELNTFSEILHELSYLLKNDFYIELREFDLLVENLLELDIYGREKESHKYMEIRIAIASRKAIHRRIKIENQTIDLDIIRSTIKGLLLAAKGKGLSAKERPIETEKVPLWMVSELFTASRDVIKWLDEFCPEILSNPHLSELRRVVNQMRTFIKEGDK